MDEGFKRCKRCKHPIRIINYLLGPTWMHIDLRASFPTERKGTAWRYCKIHVAEPDPEEN